MIVITCCVDGGPQALGHISKRETAGGDEPGSNSSQLLLIVVAVVISE